MKNPRISRLFACAMFCAGGARLFGEGISSHWTSDFDGLWSDAANWSQGPPNGIDDRALIDAFGSELTISLGGDVTLGSLIVSASRAVSIAGSGNFLNFQTGAPAEASPFIQLDAQPDAVVNVEPSITSVGALDVNVGGRGSVAFLNSISTPEGALTIRSSAGQLRFAGITSGSLDAELAAQGTGVVFGGAVTANDSLRLVLTDQNEHAQFLGNVQASQVNVAAFAPGASLDFRGDLGTTQGATFDLSGASVKIARFTDGMLHLDDHNAGGVVEIGIGAGAHQVDISTDGTARITSIESGFHGALLMEVRDGGVLDVGIDLTKTQFSRFIVSSLRLSTGGKLAAGANGIGNLQSTDMVMQGGELSFLAGQAVGALRIASGKSTITFSDTSSSQVTFRTLNVSDPTGMLLVRGSSLGSGAQRMLFATAPTLIGPGTSLPTTGILPNTVIGTSATGEAVGFATYAGSSLGVRPLAATEYSSTLVSSANIKVTGAPLTVPTSTTINSLMLVGGAAASLSSNIILTISSGMILSTNGTAALNGTGSLASPTGNVHFYTVSDLTAFTSVSASNALVKSGPATLTYRSTLAPANFIVNEGTLNLPVQAAFTQATVRSGGRLSTTAAAFAASANITVETGGRWELNQPSGSQQVAGLLGGGSVAGVGTQQLSTLTLAPTAAATVAVQFSGKLAVNFQQNEITLAGKSSHTGDTWVQGNAAVRLGIDDALSPSSMLVLDGTLDLDGHQTTVLGMKANTGTIKAGAGGTLTVAPLQDSSYLAHYFTVEGALHFVKTGAGYQDFDPLVRTGSSLSLSVLAGELTCVGSDIEAIDSVFVGSHGDLVMIDLHIGGFTTFVESGAKISRVGRPVSGPASESVRSAHIYSLQGGRETAFTLLHTDASDSHLAFADFQPGTTVSDVLTLSMSGEYVLQISYDPALVGEDLANLRLGRMAGGEWADATSHDAVPGQFVGFENWDVDFLTPGEWGINQEAHSVWAVLDQPGSFAVISVPENGTLGYIALGAAAIFLTVKRRRSMRV